MKIQKMASQNKVKFRNSLLVLRGAVGRIALLPPPAAAVAVVVELPVLPWLGNSLPSTGPGERVYYDGSKVARVVYPPKSDTAHAQCGKY